MHGLSIDSALNTYIAHLNEEKKITPQAQLVISLFNRHFK